MTVAYVRDPRSPESGVGVILEERRDSWDVFFESGVVPFEVGTVLEPWLAARLRERRFGVWQN